MEITNIVKDVDKLIPSYIAGRNVISKVVVENSLEFPQNVKY